MMTETKILQAKARALNVVNGFITINGQQARDVVWLAEALLEANQIIDAVRRHEQDKKAKAAPDGFERIFGSLKKGGATCG